ncbi:hypothetical protein HOA92_02285 [archaeon]|jgi:hypothetical protein|nr:hypothetical protein [archaeon]MBT6761843.1 hypothetical protein [archaeon]
MTIARERAFEELRNLVGEYSAELGNIHIVIDDYERNVEKFHVNDKIHKKVAQLEAISGLLLQEVLDANQLLDDIESSLDDHGATKIKVNQLIRLLAEGPNRVAGAEALEHEIQKYLEKDIKNND